jgi:hypothetical protein
MIDLTVTMYSALGFVVFVLSLCGLLYVNADRLESCATKWFRRNR